MSQGVTKGVLQIENHAVICSTGKVDAVQVRDLLLSRWNSLSCQLDDGIILFIAGAHGMQDGTLDSLETSCKTLMKQVTVTLSRTNSKPIFFSKPQNSL